MPASEIERATTKQRQEAFLVAFSESGSVGAACIASGVPVGTVDSWENKDFQGFKKRKVDAGQVFLGKVEAEINRRAIDGVEKKYFNTKGELTGSTIQYSDNLLMFRAKRLDPEYRDNPRINQQPGAVAVTKITINLAPGVEPPAEVIEATEFHEVEDGDN